MTEIKNFTYYKRYAKDFALNELNKRLDVPVTENCNMQSLGCFLSYKTPYHEMHRNGQHKIAVNPTRVETHEEMVGIIKHEVIHWYCYREGMNYNDGDKDFETMLYQHNAPSTYFGLKSEAHSKFIQTKVMNDKVGKNGLSGTQYKKCNAEDYYNLIEKNNRNLVDELELEAKFFEKSYEVYYNGAFIGYVFYLNHDKWVKQWIMVNADGTDDDIAKCNTRKEAVLPYIFKHEQQNEAG